MGQPPSQSSSSLGVGTSLDKKRKRADEESAVRDSTTRNILERTKNERRLDSVARLFEGGSTCAAVCYVNNDILITNSQIKTPTSKQFPGGVDVELMCEILQYLIHLNSGEIKVSSKETDYILLSKVCVQRIKTMNSSLQGDTYQQAIHIDLKTIRHVIEFLYNQKSQQNYITMKDALIAACLPDDEITFWKKLQGVDLNIQDPAIRKQMVVIDEKIEQINRTCRAIWWLIRDYKKSKRFFRENQIKQCKLLAVGSEKEHAEMRMIGYLWETGQLLKTKANQKPMYIGISKLCCAHCSAAIHAMNSTFGEESRMGLMFQDDKREDEITIEPDNLREHIGSQVALEADTYVQKEQNKHGKEEVSEPESDKDDELEDEQKMKIEDSAFIKRAGSHGMSFDWKKPSFLEGKKYFLPVGYELFFRESVDNILKKDTRKGAIYIVKNTGAYKFRHSNGKTICQGNLSERLTQQLQAEFDMSLKEDILEFLVGEGLFPLPISEMITGSSGTVETVVAINFGVDLDKETRNRLRERFEDLKKEIEDSLVKKAEEKRKRNDEYHASGSSVSLFHPYSSSDAELSSPSVQPTVFSIEQKEAAFVSDPEDILKIGGLAKKSLRGGESKSSDDQRLDSEVQTDFASRSISPHSPGKFNH